MRLHWPWQKNQTNQKRQFVSGYLQVQFPLPVPCGWPASTNGTPCLLWKKQNILFLLCSEFFMFRLSSSDFYFEIMCVFRFLLLILCFVFLISSSRYLPVQKALKILMLILVVPYYFRNVENTDRIMEFVNSKCKTQDIAETADSVYKNESFPSILSVFS